MKTNVEIKINQCMSCPFAHQVISDYSLFYLDYVKYDKKKPYDKDFKSEVRIYPRCSTSKETLMNN